MNQDASGRTRVLVEPEHFIPVPKHRIVESLLERIEDPHEREHFQNFCRLVEGIYHFEYHQTANDLKEDFTLFDTGAEKELLARCAPEEIEQAEERFLINFREMMVKGNFSPLTQEDIELAEEEEYLFNLPVTMDWDKLDRRMLSRFFDKHLDLNEGQRPEFADRILIYRRGIGKDQTEAYLTIQKIDVIISQMLVGFWNFGRRLLGKQPSDVLSSREPHPSEEEISEPGSGGRAALLAPRRESPAADQPRGDEVESPATVPPPAAPLPGEPAERPPEQDDVPLVAEGESLEVDVGGDATDDVAGDDVYSVAPLDSPPPTPHGGKSHMFQEKYIDRIPLRSTRVDVASLFRKTLIQEPTFKELIILFRFASKEDAEPREQDRAIHIKTFRDIPMADLEVVFPEKRISMKTLDLVKLVITGAIGVFVLAFKLLAAAVLNPVVFIVLVFTALGYALKLFVGFKTSRDRYQELVTRSLYHKNLDNDLGVIFYLMDSLEEQEFKEAVLGYYFLWQQGGSLSQEELDACCERYIQSEFGLEVDFEVDDSLQKLVTEKLITAADGRYQARPLSKALEVLDYKWDHFFEYNSNGSDDLT